MTGPIRYTADKGTRAVFELFDQTIAWSDAILYVGAILGVWLVWEIWKSRRG